MNDAPFDIRILTRHQEYGDAGEPIAAETEPGKALAWADAGIEQVGNRLMFRGQPYAYLRRIKEEQGDDYLLYRITAWRRQSGWQVLTTHDVRGTGTLAPDHRHPYESLEQAERYAREVVTRNLSAYATPVRAEIVWQTDRGRWGKPVAGLDGANHDRRDAARAILDGTWLELDWKNDEAGDGGISPASNDAILPAEDGSDSTTDGQGRQAATPPATIAMVIRYQGTGASVVPTGEYQGSTAELVQWLDGRHDRPPDGNVERLRFWLTEHGYQPDYGEWQWLDRGPGPRRRREVYRLGDRQAAQDRYDTVDRNLLQEFARENPTSTLSNAERRQLYRQKALDGAPEFAACQECRHLQDCPFDYGACDRKAELARKRQGERDRPHSDRNPAVHVFWTY